MTRFILYRIAAFGLAILVILLSLSQVQAQEGHASIWVGFEDGSAPAQPEVWVEEQSTDGIQFGAHLPGVWGQASEDGSAARFRLEGESGQEPGGLDLPVLRWTVDAPLGAEVILEDVSASERPFLAGDFGLPEAVAQVQAETCKCEDDQPAFVLQDSAGQNLAPVSIGSIYVERGRQQVVVEFRPVGVVDGGLVIRGEVRGRLRFQGGTEETGLSVFSAEPSMASQHYLILVPDAYASSIEPFARLKEAEGFTVSVARLSQVGDTTAQIRDYVRKAYQSQGLAYLLLVGDTLNGDDSLPSWAGQVIRGPTDLYYATLDGADWVPDLQFGRLPLRTAAEVSAFAARAVAYAGRQTENLWGRAASFLATCDTGHSNFAEGTHNSVINSYTLPGGFWGRFPVNPQAGGDQLYCVSRGASYGTVQTAVTSGRSLLAYSGHGTEQSWEFGVTSGGISSLAGSQAAPVVLSYACQTGDFSTQRSLGEAWMSDGGALAFVGASADTYWGPDDLLEREMFQALFASGGTLSGALQSGLSEVYDSMPGYAQIYYEAYHVFGDPSLKPLAAPQAGSLKVAAESTQLAVCAGGAASTSVRVNAEPFYSQLDGGNLSFMTSGLPDGLNAGFEPGAGGESRLEVRAEPGARPGIYTFNVEAQSSTGIPVTGSSASVQVDDEAPSGAPLLEWPLNEARDQPLRPELRWQPVDGAAGYDVEIAADSGFTQVVDSALAVQGTSYRPQVDLAYGMRYFWRVRAGNACGGSYSQAAAFTLTAGGPACQAGSPSYTLYHEGFQTVDAGGWLLGDGGNIVNTLADPALPQDGSAVVVATTTEARDGVITSPPITIPEESSPVLSFWLQRDLEGGPGMCYDAAVLEISRDGARSWSILSPQGVPYNGVGAPGSTLAGKAAWCGSFPGGRASVDLSAYEGQTVQLRLRVASDSSGANTAAFALDSVAIHSCHLQPVFGLEARPTQPQVMALPGREAVISLDITNHGNVEDQVEVMALDSPWKTRVEAPGGIRPQGTAQAKVMVDVPADAVPGEWIEIGVTVTSVQNPEVRTVVKVNVAAALQATWLPFMR